MPLPGHYFGMIGVRTPDDVLFLADSLFSAAILAEYPVFFPLRRRGPPGGRDAASGIGLRPISRRGRRSHRS
ncbi:MAG: hypothetical protein ACYDA8_21285 [Deferrisomatales bacterium]